MFYILLWSIILFVLAGGLEICSRLAVYGLGLRMKAEEPDYYSRLKKSDPAYQFAKPLYTPHAKFGWVQTPDNEGIYRGFRYPRAEFRTRVRINRSGFRSSSEYTVDPKKLRVAVLGDSFVQALQVKEEDSFPKVVERLLKARGRDAFVYNFGVSSTGTIHQYQILKEAVLKVRPQVLVLAFFPNDLTDDSPYYVHEDPNLIPQYSLTADGRVDLQDFGGQKDGQSVLQNYVLPRKEGASWAEKWMLEMDKAGARWPFLKSPRFIPAVLNERFTPKNFYSAHVDVYKKVYPPALAGSLKVTLYFLEEIQRLCRAEGVELLVVLVPALEQVDRPMWDQFLDERKGYLSGDDFDLERPNRVIGEELGRRGIRYLDLLPSFRKEFWPSRFYYGQDQHWNAAGHRKAGTIIEKYLGENFLRPPGR